MRTTAPIVRFIFLALALVGAAAPASAQPRKLGPLAERAARLASGFSPVIIQAANGGSLSDVRTAIQQNGGIAGRPLPIINAQAAYLPNAALNALSDHASVIRVSLDRSITGVMERTGATVGASVVRDQLGLDGSGVGVALIDSGVTSWHDDLSWPWGGQRVSAFVDLVNGRSQPYDDYGHGTHVAGIVAGNGFDSSGARSGIAPGASLIVLKALDENGGGRISHVIAAFDYVLAHKNEFNIRVVNLSLSSGVFESFTTDPLAVAARKLVEAGIVVVAAAGNAGGAADGRAQYGAVTSPGNAPWVLTVGASSHMGTVDRVDDTMALFSSRGPTALDVIAKPDLVAPGVGIESLSDPLSAFYTSKAPYLLDGAVERTYRPYLSLSGTSMATPVVSGSVALMLQANPSLTPNAVKAILQFTSQVHPRYNRLTQGVGFLNTRGAVELASFLGGTGETPPSSERWSRELIWGNHLVRGGDLAAGANAWSSTVTWGSSSLPGGAPVQWGLRGDGTPWGISCADATCSSVAWQGARNVVWGAACGGDDCATAWTPSGAGAAITSASENEIVVWGSTDDNQIVVWGSADDNQIVVWGSADNSMVVWGSSGEFEIVVWGSDCAACEPVIWGR
jgi:serine protease AprX